MTGSNSKMLSLIDDRKRHSELLNRLNIMRKSKAFCDVTIIVENQEFMAHKVILASSSDYFLSKFTEDDNCDRLSLSLEKDIFNLLLEYFYTSNLLVSKENVPQIFAAAKYLKVRRVVKVCEQFLSNNLTTENVVEIRKSITAHECEFLCKASDEFIRDNMDSILKEGRINTIKMDIIVEALPKKESESPLAELVVDWLDCAITDDHMKLSDFVDENIALFLTPSNSLVQASEINSNKSSTFIKDYLHGFINSQKNINKKFKSRPRSRERNNRHSLTSGYNRKKLHHHQYDSPTRISNEHSNRDKHQKNNEEVIMISSDEPNGSVNIQGSSNIMVSDGGEVNNCISGITPTVDNVNSYTNNEKDELPRHNINSVTTSTQGSDSDPNNLDEQNLSETQMDDYDSISSSIKSKTGGDAESESCVITVRCEKLENIESESGGIQRIQFIGKVCGSFICVSLHMRSVLDMINQGLYETGDDVSMLLVGGGNQQLTNTVSSVNNTITNANSSITSSVNTYNNNTGALYNNTTSCNNYYSDSVTSGMSSSNISAASSQLHIDTICNMYSNDEQAASNSVNGSVTSDYHSFHHSSIASEDQVQLFHHLLKKVQHNCTLDPISHMATSRCAAGLVNINDTLMVIGGFNRGECLDSTEIYEPYNNAWINGSTMGTNRARLVALSTNTSDASDPFICAIGGSDGYKELYSVERYDVKSELWTQIARLKQARCHHGGCVLQSGSESMGQFVVVGGLFGPDSLKCSEIYDPNRNEWTNLAPLMNARNQASVATLDNQVFVVGGSDSWHCLSTCEVMDIREGKWRQIPELGHSRRGAAMVAHNGNLYLFGGSDGQSSLKSMEIFDLKTNQWHLSNQQLKQPRVNVCGSVLFDKWLVAVGGYTGKHFLDTVEVGIISNDHLNDEWSMSLPSKWKQDLNNTISLITDNGDINEEHETTITSGNNLELVKQAQLLQQNMIYK